MVFINLSNIQIPVEVQNLQLDNRFDLLTIE